MSAVQAAAAVCLSCLSLYLAWRIYREPRPGPKTRRTHRQEMETYAR